MGNAKHSAACATHSPTLDPTFRFCVWILFSSCKYCVFLNSLCSAFDKNNIWRPKLFTRRINSVKWKIWFVGILVLQYHKKYGLSSLHTVLIYIDFANFHIFQFTESDLSNNAFKKTWKLLVKYIEVFLVPSFLPWVKFCSVNNMPVVNLSD